MKPNDPLLGLNRARNVPGDVVTDYAGTVAGIWDDREGDGDQEFVSDYREYESDDDSADDQEQP
jgi:hypothetical protein